MMYDVPNQRIQVWKYDVEKGWMQIGKDLSVKFAVGDVFTVRAGKNGAFEIYQNGELLGKRDMTVQSIQLVISRLSRRSYRVNESKSPILVTPQMADVFFTEYVMQAQSYSTTITYDYDDLHRLTEANYSNGDYYHYGYDAVGNRLSQEAMVSGLLTNTAHDHDDANRLTNLNGVAYTWDNNGNLLSDDVNDYDYDSANRLKTMSGQSTVSSYDPRPSSISYLSHAAGTRGLLGEYRFPGEQRTITRPGALPLRSSDEALSQLPFRQ